MNEWIIIESGLPHMPYHIVDKETQEVICSVYQNKNQKEIAQIIVDARKILLDRC